MTISTSGIQGSFSDLGTPLADVTFVVVDLETTGTKPGPEGITEIGAVKTRGGEILGEFATLVDPGAPIPPQIERLTGITTRMVHDAPRISAVLPQFLSFLGHDSVLVAHNAPFDVGFLKAACQGAEIEWPRPDVVDSLALARALVSRDEARNHRLGTLAALFSSATTPNHRALHDARATVDVLHALFGRLGALGVTTREDLLTFDVHVPPRRRRKVTIADALPEVPGVYVFEDAEGLPLYVGTSGNIRRRVKTYFTRSEKRRGMGLMVDLAQRVIPIPCATALEAHVREIRLIAQHEPRFNRRSTRPDKVAWLKLTQERFPRLSVVREVKDDGASYIGPFRSHASAECTRTVLHDTHRLRQCTQRITLRTKGSICVLGEIGRCDAPCVGGITTEKYGVLVDDLREELTDDTAALIAQVHARLARLTGEQRFEEARDLRDDLLEMLRGLDRHQRRATLIANPELVAAKRSPAGEWEFVAVSFGRLTGAARCPVGRDPMAVVDSLRLSAEVVQKPLMPRGAALPEETDVILRWLERPGTRLVVSETPWASPRQGAGRELARLDPLVRRAWGTAGSSLAR